ncbi:C-type lectin-like, partial [Varanus komodoensis]|uniref:C-type lectin-like n=1 Tax=Varanus komodoensis TaxID=61221 RepID=UPI001CF7AEB0
FGKFLMVSLKLIVLSYQLSIHRIAMSAVTIETRQKMQLLTSRSFCLVAILLSHHFLEAMAQHCPRRWLRYLYNCYAYFDSKVTWQQAEVDCQTYGFGAHLASILNAAESAIVAEYISRFQQTRSDVWIGLHDPFWNQRWRWADRSAYNYKAWLPGEPNNQGKMEHCVELRKSTDFKQWNDVSCSKKNAYICKIQY